MEIEQTVNNIINKVYLKIYHSGKGNDSDGGLPTKSDVICCKCGKKGHIQRYCKPNKMVPMGNHKRRQLDSFLHGSPISLLFLMWKIWQHSPWPAIRKGKNGVFPAILVMVNGSFTGNIVTISRNKSNTRKSLSVFSIMQPIN